MGTLRITEAELARDVHRGGRLLSESIALAESRRTTAIPDEGFVRDVEEGIAERSKPWNPVNWE